MSDRLERPGSVIRAVIVDDEAAARSRIRQLLRKEADVTVVAEARNGREALAAVRETDPDLLFLDVQMPGMDGFDVLEEVSPESLPAVIFVTAYDRYALRAFERHAVDYLLKPFDDDRFGQALDHVRTRLRERRADRLRSRMLDLLEDSGSRRGEVARKPTDGEAVPGLSRILVRRGDRMILVDVRDVDWLEAAGDYVRVHAGERAYLARNTMARLEEELGDAFIRVHRSAIVRTDAVRELRPTGHGDHDVVLGDGTKLRLSRTYRDRLASALGVEL